MNLFYNYNINNIQIKDNVILSIIELSFTKNNEIVDFNPQKNIEKGIISFNVSFSKEVNIQFIFIIKT